MQLRLKLETLNEAISKTRMLHNKLCHIACEEPDSKTRSVQFYKKKIMIDPCWSAVYLQR